MKPPLVLSQPRPLRILIVDDDDGYAASLTAILMGNPRFEVVGRAVDGVAGVHLARALRPDVVVMDVNMPRLDGFGATHEILAELPATRVVIVSADPEADHRLRAREAGADAYLPKDCDLAELDRVIAGVDLRAETYHFLALAM